MGIGDPHVLRAVVGTGAFLAVFALVGLASGGVFFIAPMLFGAISDTLGCWTLQAAFEALSTTIALPPDASRPSAGQAACVCVVCLVVTLAAAALLIRRREA